MILSPDGKAEIIVNGDRFSVDMSYLQTVWSGEYTLLYRSVPGSEGQESVSPSDCKSECVTWLRKSLSRALNIAEFRDKKLTQRVSELIRSFQQTRDLPADGKIGQCGGRRQHAPSYGERKWPIEFSSSASLLCCRSS